MAVDTGCSSSLVAIHLACQSLQNQESHLCLVGGVNLILSPEPTIAFSQAGMMSSVGRCQTFDASADGYVRGEGCAVVVLKRLRDALEDRDRIVAVIRGSAVNQDGLSNGLTAPNGPAQQAVIRQALANAQVQPAQISYVEAHGTGTSLGDPIEMKSLKAILSQGRSLNQPCWIGSVKTNIGHLEAAAGIAGLIKVVLSLQHQEIPPHLHLKKLNPYISLAGTPFIIPTNCQPWDVGKNPRLAGISSFGFGGTNSHVIVEEAPFEERKRGGDEERGRIWLGNSSIVQDTISKERSFHLLTLSAKSEQALQELASRYEEFLIANPEVSIADVCFTANTGRSHFQHRLALVGQSIPELQAQLSAFTAGQETSGNITSKVTIAKPDQIAFLFTGQGSQYIGMGRELYETQPTFRKTLDYCNEILLPDLEQPLLSVLYPDNESIHPQLDRTAYAQPALFALEYALFELWKSWGVEPTAVMGHSLGEYVAACVAGVFSLEDGLKLIAHRGRLMEGSSSDGEMVAVFADYAQVEDVIQPYVQQVAIAAINDAKNIVISGDRQAVGNAIAILSAAGVQTKRLNVSRAFHSPLMVPILADFEQVARKITYSSPQIKVISNLTGEVATDEIATPDYWCRHILQPVRFAAGMETMYRDGFQVFVECGPKPTLVGMGSRCLPESPGIWLPSLHPGYADWQQMLQSCANLYISGVQINWSGFDRDYAHRRLQLPTYPFQRSRYWFEILPDKPTEEKSGVSRRWDAVAAAGGYQAQQGPFDLELHIYPAKLESYNSLTTAYIITALQKLGIYRQAGERHTVESLLSQFQILPTYSKLLSRWLEILVTKSLLQPEKQVFFNKISLPQISPEDCLHQAKLHSQNTPQLIDFIQHCGENLVDVLVGKLHPLELIFPGGSSAITNYLYQESPEARYFNGIARSVLEAVVKTQPSAKSLRILEVGAGTGGTTGSLLPILPQEITSYWFTDVSDLFLEKAKHKFKTYSFIQYNLLDIEQNPQNQGYPLHSFDVVVAVNVLHATRDLEETLENVRSLLAPDGLLIVVEVTNPPSWLDITFALSEGWQEFNDSRRGKIPLLSQTQWESLLRDCGFDRLLVLPNSGLPTEILGQKVLVAQSGLLTKDATSPDLTWMPRKPDPGVREIAESPKSDCLLATNPNNLDPSQISKNLGYILTPPFNKGGWGGEDFSDKQISLPKRDDPNNLDRKWESQLHQKLASILGISIFDLNINTPLSNLRFDSLMAVELTNWIAKELGVNISVVSFPAGANITQLTNQVREAINSNATKKATESQPYPCLISLQPQGSKPPFFCVHPIAGVVFPYYELSSILDKDQPFYGLQSFSLAGEGKPLTRIEDMAAHYIKAMQTVQPQGPYFLGGWSFGAYVAFEIAQQLQEDGENVALLAAIDTPPISGNKTANFVRLLQIFISVSLRYIWPYVYDYLYLATAANKSKQDEKQGIWLIERLSALLKSPTLAKAGLNQSKFMQLQQPILRHLLPVIWANSQALVNYIPKEYPDKITLFQSSQSLVTNREDIYWGWKDFALKGIDICQIPGHHLNCLRMPHVKVLAEQLANYIEGISR
jgi:malonyl CoA-acyl carrier protein transacylase/thioesterase domain-containing protein/SAM-dependent methyltransferase/acyl carrier protein